VSPTVATRLRVNEAYALVSSIADPVLRVLISVGFTRADCRFAITLTADGKEIPPRRPAASFDMEFFVRVLRALFSRLDRFQRILEGESVRPAPVVYAPMALNDAAAERVRLAINDPICRNLVTAAINEARRLLVKLGTANDVALGEAPPCSPFDMEFFATVMEECFYMIPLFKQIVAGQYVGWD
jgi:hypothetical protein